MTYKRMVSTSDPDIPCLISVLKRPEIARFISIDENNYWYYVTSTANVFFFKVFKENALVGAIHCEISDKDLSMYIVVFPEYHRKGIATNVLRDIQSGNLPLDFERIEVFIDVANIASIALFEKMNFKYVSREDELVRYIYTCNELKNHNDI